MPYVTVGTENDYDTFTADLNNVDKLAPDRISEQAWQASFNVAVSASPHASYACVDSWLTDFRADLPKIDAPVLVMHGTEDRILPFESTAKRLPQLVPNLKLIPVEGWPHNIGWTHPEEVNKALLEFSPKTAAAVRGSTVTCRQRHEPRASESYRRASWSSRSSGRASVGGLAHASRDSRPAPRPPATVANEATNQASAALSPKPVACPIASRTTPEVITSSAAARITTNNVA